MGKPYPLLLLSMLILGLSSCAPLMPPPPPPPTETPLGPTVTPTATTVWFPPTPTNTPMPTATLSLTPTIDTRPQFGNLLFQDDFSTSVSWSSGRVSDGRISPGQNELSLVVTRDKGYLYSIRPGVALSDFYLEINASPSICRDGDEYGLLLRVSPDMDFYRFSLSCRGEARVDRFLNNAASSPQPPILSGAVPPGAPSISRLAVWAVGKEMRFYANGEYLFTVIDPTIPMGYIGVFVRAATEDMVSVSFSDLKVYKPR